MRRTVIVTLAAALVMAAVVTGYVRLAPQSPPAMMGGGQGMVAGPVVPPVKGYTQGRDILFIHTETSDPKVARMLTAMMGSPVLVVPSLAQAPAAMLANVYVFTNGVKAGGPFGFQPDVFDHPPGTPGYSPLRAVHLVTWKDGRAARELKSVAEVLAAQASADVIIERPDAVVNMPFLTWPGGQR